MIDPALANAFDRIAARDADVRGAYQPGFTPAASDVARPSRAFPDRDPLSVALPEGAYVLTPDKNNRITYSRDGSFALRDGELRAAGGGPVLGFALGTRTSLVALRVDPYDTALGRVASPRVEGDGTVSYVRTTVDPRSGERRSERVAIGRLALARFPAGTQLERVDPSHVIPPHGVGALVGVPADGQFAALTTNARDSGRVDIIAGLEKMKEAYVTFEALRAAHRGRGDAEKTVMDLVK